MASATVGDAKNAFRNEVLLAHNMCREMHGVPNLTLGSGLNEECQEYAEELLNAETIDYSPYWQVGENIYILHVPNTYPLPSGHEVVEDWYGQSGWVEYGEEPKDETFVNFSQVVWGDTSHLGVGVARNNSKIVVVCHYWPPGNILGEYANNVFPAEFESAMT